MVVGTPETIEARFQEACAPYPYVYPFTHWRAVVLIQMVVLPFLKPVYNTAIPVFEGAESCPRTPARSATPGAGEPVGDQEWSSEDWLAGWAMAQENGITPSRLRRGRFSSHSRRGRISRKNRSFESKLAAGGSFGRGSCEQYPSPPCLRGATPPRPGSPRWRAPGRQKSHRGTQLPSEEGPNFPGESTFRIEARGRGRFWRRGL